MHHSAEIHPPELFAAFWDQHLHVRTQSVCLCMAQKHLRHVLCCAVLCCAVLPQHRLTFCSLSYDAWTGKCACGQSPCMAGGSTLILAEAAKKRSRLSMLKLFPILQNSMPVAKQLFISCLAQCLLLLIVMRLPTRCLVQLLLPAICAAAAVGVLCNQSTLVASSKLTDMWTSTATLCSNKVRYIMQSSKLVTAHATGQICKQHMTGLT